MRLLPSILTGCIVLSIFFSSCSKHDKSAAPKDEISSEVLAKIEALGFRTNGVIAKPGGYVVEGDIFLSNEDLNGKNVSDTLRIGKTEQYRTNNLVTGLPRTITIALSGLSVDYTNAADVAIARYNAQGLRISFLRVSSGANITISGFWQAPDPVTGSILLGSAGFPSGGNPYSQILMNTHPSAYGTSPDVNYMGTVIAHEVGHCIGFRHTDYMDRSFSCGGSFSNEGAGSEGAVGIPNTPSVADPNSWMLACTGFGVNRPFNNNDITALHQVYGTCTGNDKRMVGGSCQTGTRVLNYCEPSGLGGYLFVYYHYTWSDGFNSPTYTSMSRTCQ